MTRNALLKILGIGCMHVILYGYLVPFVVYPRFGHRGFLTIVVIAVMISVGIIASIFVGRKTKGEKK